MLNPQNLKALCFIQDSMDKCFAWNYAVKLGRGKGIKKLTLPVTKTTVLSFVSHKSFLIINY